MTSETGDKGSGPGKPPSAGRRPAPTIELKATELTSAPVAEGRSSPAGPADVTGPATAAQSEAAAPPHAKAETKAGGTPPRAPNSRWPLWDRFPDGLPLPLIGTAIAAAVILFLLGFVTASFFVGREGASDARVERIEAADDLAERLAKVEAAQAASRNPDAALLARLATAEAAAKLAAETAAAQQRRAEELAGLVRDARNRADAAVAAAEAAQKGSAASAPEAARADVDALNQRMAALEQALKSNEAELARRSAVAADDSKSRVAVVAAVLLAAVERGAPFAAELTAAKSLAPTASLAPLEPFATAGVPAAQALSRELSAKIPAMLKVTQSETQRDGGFLEKLQANAERLVRVRPVGEVAGDRPVDVIARIEAKANASDIAGALQELAKLPPQVRAPAEDWIKKAAARNAALAAAHQFSTAALAAIGKPNT